MNWTTKKRTLTVTSRNTNGDLTKQTFNDIKTTDIAPEMPATYIKNAISFTYQLSENSYVDATITDSFDINEEAAKEEDGNG